MIVLSLFDGMSCGQIALRQLGIKVDKYYVSEVDKFAIAQTMLNFPDTVQLGDVRNIDARKLGHIDLLMGGSPCQSFSFAGKRAGMSTKQKEEIYTLERYLELKQAGFEFEGQSYLFWEYVRILHRLYDRLDDEATPYALRVGKGENHLKAITIYCDGKDVDYFTNILNNEI